MRPSARILAFAVAVCGAIGLAYLGRAWAQTSDASVTLRIVVLSTNEAAEAVLARLKAGESFAMLARSTSMAPSADDGGWLGKQRLADLRPEIRAAVERLSAG